MMHGMDVAWTLISPVMILDRRHTGTPLRAEREKREKLGEGGGSEKGEEKSETQR